MDVSHIDPGLDSRSASFENPTGARGAGGTAQGGRKGAAASRLQPDERVVLLDTEGPGTIRHIWTPQPVPRLDVGLATAGIERRDYESPSEDEVLMNTMLATEPTPA